MTLRLTIASSEVEDFVIEILIDANATFLDLHRTILRACHYEQGEKHRFYICDEDWRPELRILLADEGITRADEDLYLMEDTTLGDFLEDEGQRMAYRFDPQSKRLFLIELTETLFGQRVEEPKARRHGMPPAQTLEEEDDAPATPQSPHSQAGSALGNSASELDESFYGDEGYEADEIDIEGFDILN